MKKLKENKGITLIALIITIIVMLILVGVTVTVALNGGLFGKAKDTSKKYTKEKEKELIQAAYADYVAQKYTGGPKTEDFDALEIDLLGDYRKGKDISNKMVEETDEETDEEEEEVEYAIIFEILGENIGILEDDLEFDEENYSINVCFEYNGNRYILTLTEEEDENNEETYKIMSKKLIVEPELTLGELATVTTNRINGHKEWEIVFVDSGNKYWLTDGDDEITEDINIDLPEGWTKIDRPSEWKEGTENKKVIAITDGINTIPLPLGYTLSDKEEEQTVAGGLVIKDSNQNEFVWIPAANFNASYDNGNNYYQRYREPSTTLYADNGIYDASDRRSHYAEMVESVNKYGGFYVGRYETTIDIEGNVGSKINTTVLTAGVTLYNDISYDWTWLYAIQRENIKHPNENIFIVNNVIGNSKYVQTNMIWAQQWDAMIKFLGDEQAESTISGTQTQVLKSGEATYEDGAKDVINNIYDLRRNGLDWTAEVELGNYGYGYLVARGGYYDDDSKILNNRWTFYANDTDNFLTTRMTLYIK